MKKDLFNGKIKHEFVSYMWASLISIAVVFFGLSGLFFYAAFSTDAIFLFVLGVASCLLGIWNTFGTVILIRNYPKYPKLRRSCLNSDCYFVGSDTNEFRGHRRGRAAFNAVTQIAAQNEDLENIKYPKKYRVYMALSIIGIVLLFANIVAAYIAVENMELLPKALQSEPTIVTILFLAEGVDAVLSFVFAFRVRKIRKITIAEYRKERLANKIVGHGK